MEWELQNFKKLLSQKDFSFRFSKTFKATDTNKYIYFYEHFCRTWEIGMFDKEWRIENMHLFGTFEKREYVRFNYFVAMWSNSSADWILT